MKGMLIGAVLSALLATILIVSGVELSWQFGLGVIILLIIVGRITNYFMEKSARGKHMNDG